jgi:hypothetical protein
MRATIVIAAVAATLALAGCSRTEQGAVVGGATGAAVGAIATGTPQGAFVGGALGAAGGAIIGAVSERPGYCYYRDRYGRRYTDRC